MKKIKNAFIKVKDAAFGASIAVLAGLATAVAFITPAFASESVVSATDWAPVITAMTAQINVAGIVGVLATLATSAIGLVFLWWGVRKAIGVLMSAFRSGRIHL